MWKTYNCIFTPFNNQNIVATSYNLPDGKITPINRVILEGVIQAPLTRIYVEEPCENGNLVTQLYIQLPLCVYRVSKEKFSGKLEVKKHSTPDIIPVRIRFTDLISQLQDSINPSDLEGKFLRITDGNYYSCYENDKNGNHVAFHVYAKEFQFIDSTECRFQNRILLRGFICTPEFNVRRTGAGPIIDLKIAVSRKEYTLEELFHSNKDFDEEYPTDYIQCITWNAVTDSLINYYSLGDLIDVEGRIQSRTFQRQNDLRQILEISVINLTSNYGKLAI